MHQNNCAKVFSLITKHATPTLELRRQKFSASSKPEDTAPEDGDQPEDTGVVYGIVRTHAPPEPPPNAIRVHDPAKDILGMLGSRPRASGHRHRFSSPTYGRVNTHKTHPKSHFDILRKEVYKDRDAENKGQQGQQGQQKQDSKGKPGDQNYGVVHYYAPANPTQKPMGIDALFQSVKSNDKDSHNNVKSSSAPSAFDRIRAKLMNTKLRTKLQNAHRRGLRRKGSRKRRRNVSKEGAF